MFIDFYFKKFVVCFLIGDLGMNIVPSQSVDSLNQMTAASKETKQVESFRLNESQMEVSDADHETDFEVQAISHSAETGKLGDVSKHSDPSVPVENLSCNHENLSDFARAAAVNERIQMCNPESSFVQPDQTFSANSASVEPPSATSVFPLSQILIHSSPSINFSLGPSIVEAGEVPPGVPRAVPPGVSHANNSVPEMDHGQPGPAHDHTHEGFFRFFVRDIFEANVSFSIQFRDLRNSSN